MDLSKILTLADVREIAEQIGATATNPLGFSSSCEGAGLRGVFLADDGAIELQCTHCGGTAGRFALAGGADQPQPFDPASSGLIDLGGWHDGTVPPQEHDLTRQAVQTHLAAMRTLPKQVRNNVMASIVLSFLMSFNDPADALKSMTDQINGQLPNAVARRSLHQAKPAGRA